MKPQEKKRAIELRELGYSFSRIIKTLKGEGMSVSKGGLHKWFKNKDE